MCFPRPPFIFPIIAFSALSACGGTTTLDLGHAAPPSYATPETIAAGDNAPPGVPTPIATHQRFAYAIAVNDERVFWSTIVDYPNGPIGCIVNSCLKHDCAGSLVTYASPECEGPANRLLATRTHVLWSSMSGPQPSRIFSCPIEGCPGETPAIWARGGSLTFTVDDTHLYWQTSDAMIWRCPLDRCPEDRTLVALRDSLPETTRAMDPAVDETHIYWFDKQGDVAVIKTAPKDGSGTPRNLAFDIGDASDLAADKTHVYWLRPLGAGAAVLRCARTDCSPGPVVLTNPEPAPPSSSTGSLSTIFRGLVLREGQFLWLTDVATPAYGLGPSSVRACPVDGCGATPTTIVQNQRGVSGMAVDHAHVYWTSATLDETMVQRIRRYP